MLINDFIRKGVPWSFKFKSKIKVVGSPENIAQRILIALEILSTPLCPPQRQTAAGDRIVFEAKDDES